MNTSKPVTEILNSQFKVPFESARSIYLQNVISVKSVVQELENISTAVRQGLITFKKKSQDEGKENKNDIPEEEIKENDNRPSRLQKKKRGRPKKTLNSQEEDSQTVSESSDGISLDDSNSSVSSTRSRRAAAQAADHKLTQVQNFIKAKKLRRPTDFSDKPIKSSTLSSSPSKCYLANGKHYSGSSQEEEINQIVENKKNRLLQQINNENTLSRVTTNSCYVSINKLNSPKTKSLTNKNNRRKSRSLEKFSGKRKSDDLFGDILNSKKVKDNESEHLQTSEHKSSKRTYVFDQNRIHTLNSSETESVIQHSNLPVAQSSPINKLSAGEFNGFDVKSAVKSKTLRKNANHIAVEQKDKTNKVNDKTIIIENEKDESLIVISPKYKNAQSTKPYESKTDDDENEEKVNESPKNKLLAGSNSPEVNIRSRTKTIRKHIKKSTSEEEASNLECNEVDKKVNECDNIVIENKSKNLKSKIKQPMQVIDKQNKNVITESPMSQAPDHGDLVKQRVKDFEKLKNGPIEVQEEKKTGRITRNAAKNKAMQCSTEPQKSKITHGMVQLAARCVKNFKRITLDKMKLGKMNEEKENIPNNTVASNSKVLSVERVRLTPLATNNRMTPGFDSCSKPHVMNKGVNSVNRQVPVENNQAFIQKQAADEVEKRRKEEERVKRQAKEEEAKKKKEKTLKASAEETRRKREEKLQKVAAAREAAEREKALLAAKAEKEKEEKMRQIAIEKEKQKEEQLKKKLLMQQKTLEHEERRKQEEAARLAKLKEQEEEHKRLLAMKEREQEMAQKHQKAADQRLAESEKNKHQGGKLGKPINSAKEKLQQGMTPSENSNTNQSAQSYEITPAREDRPLLNPKTENDYGIDDAHSGDSSDEETQPKKIIPLWAQMENRQRLLRVNNYLPKEIWVKFMEADTRPDINRIFAGNPIKKRIRTSSAVWKTPPRCSPSVSK